MRSLSNFQAGGYSAVLVVLALSLVFFVTMPEWLRGPSDELLGALVGIGGAVFLAYTVGMSSLFRDLRRGSDTEVFIGFLVGLGFSGIAGVGTALVLLEVSKPFGWLAHLAMCWAGSSLLLLAALVATLPLFSYERARASYLNDDDE